MGCCRGLFDRGAVVGAVAGIISVRANGSICAQRGKDVGVSARGFDGGLG